MKIDDERYYEKNEVLINKLIQERDALQKKLNEEILARKNAEAALKESINQFQNIFKNAPIGIYRTTPDGKIIIANPALIEMLGYESLEDLQKIDLESDGFTSDSPRANYKFLVENSGKIFGYETCWFKKDGSCFYGRESSVAIKDEHGNLLYYEGTVENITERVLALESLKNSEEKYRIITESTTDVIWTMDLNMKYTYISPSIQNLTGYSPEEHINLSLEERLSEDSSEFVKQEYLKFIKKIRTGQILDRNRAIKTEIKYKHKNGSLIWAELIISVLFDNECKPIGIHGVSRNISERKIAQDLLIEQRNQLRILIDTIPDLIYFKDIQSNFLIVNLAQARFLGENHPYELIGKNDFNYYHQELAKQYYDDEQKIIKSGIPIFDKEEPCVDRNGNKLILNTSKVPLKDKTDNIIGIVGVGRDITKMKEAENALKSSEQNLREVNASKDKFFSIIAHDLKSPFMGILGLLKIIHDEHSVITKTELLEMISAIQDSAKRVYSLLENLLDWACIQRDGIHLYPNNFDLNKIISKNIEFVRFSASMKNISIINNVSENIEIYADNNSLDTIFRNLLSNAVKFTNHDGEIEIFTKNTDLKTIEVFIKDNGIGIKETILSNLFKIDSCQSSVGTAEEHGSGLGLIICKDLIEKNGGNIFVESEFGKGTTFKFTIPLSKFDS